jgi:cell division cycle 14
LKVDLFSKDRFYFASFPTKSALTSFQESLDSSDVMFTIDRVLQYEPFCHDFGPLNMGKLYRFCQMVNTKLEDPEFKDSKIIVYTANGSKKRSNLAYLVGAYQVLCLNRSADEAWKTISKDRKFTCIQYVNLNILSSEPDYMPFRDASMGQCTYKLTVEHCITAVQTGVRLGFVDWYNFDIESYEHYERVENGDLTVVVPGKFVHFSGPTDTHKDSDGYPTLSPDHYAPIFKKLGVTDIVRLNQPLYDRNTFINHGFNHHEMYFVDGTTPSQALLDKFIKMCENAKGAIAVHCKAGLGRTGTVVGCYLMKHYRMTASEVIGWMRVCRPGSVLGPQQQYLERMQSKMWNAGANFKEKLGNEQPKESPFWLQPWSGNAPVLSTQPNPVVSNAEEEDDDGFMLMAVDDESEVQNAAMAGVASRASVEVEESFGIESTKGMDIDGTSSIGVDNKVLPNRYSTGGSILSGTSLSNDLNTKVSQGDILMRQKTEAQKHRFLL